MEAVPTNAGATSIVYQAPHPHAAVLMADFILSPEGQKILENLEFGNPSKDFGFKRWYPEARTQYGAIRQRSDGVAESVAGDREEVRVQNVQAVQIVAKYVRRKTRFSRT